MHVLGFEVLFFSPYLPSVWLQEVPPTDLEKAPATAAASKPAPARSSKPRPKSRMSRYRSSSSQRARRQRQALAQQAAELGQGVAEEGTAGAAATEPGVGEGALGGGQPLDADGLGGVASGALGNKAQLRYPKTKKVRSSPRPLFCCSSNEHFTCHVNMVFQ